MKQHDKRKGLDKGYELVAKMHEVFGHPVTNTPTKLTEERAKIRASFMQEELEEFLEATTVEDQYDALIDLIYFAFGTFAEMGVRPDKGFEIVNNANMAKLFPDGKPRFREGDGKILKPEGWQAPEPQLRAEIERQRQEAEKLLGFPSSFYYVFFWQSLMTHVSRMSCSSTNASRSRRCPRLLLQFHLSKEKIVVVDTVGVVGVVGLGNLDDHVDLGDRGGLDTVVMYLLLMMSMMTVVTLVVMVAMMTMLTLVAVVTMVILMNLIKDSLWMYMMVAVVMYLLLMMSMMTVVTLVVMVSMMPWCPWW